MMRWDVVSGLLDNPTLGAELGAHAGKFTEELLMTFPSLTLYAVDTWTPRAGCEGYDFPTIRKQFEKRTDPFSDRITTLQMDTVRAATFARDATMDFVFIDADHSYEAVAADIDAWRSKVKPGGLLSGHDYGHSRFPGVKKAVDERFDVVGTGDDCVWWVRC
jgi:hypothetical protein